MEEEALFVTDEQPFDDPVVSEIPVYLNNQTGDNLVLLQYPTRKGVESNKISAVRLKPSSQTLEADLESDIPSNYIDSQTNGSALMGIKQTYSGVLNPNSGKFAAGYIHDDGLHLSLVPRTGQLRPKFASKSSTLLQPSMLQGNGQNKQSGSALKDVQYSVKPTTTEGPKHSSALDFWRQANKEHAEDYACSGMPENQKRAMLAVPTDNAERVECEDAASKMSFLQ